MADTKHVSDRLQRCEQQLRQDEERSRRVMRDLDIFQKKVDSGEISFDDFDDPSVVRHIDDLRERVRRESPGPISSHAVRSR